MADTMRQPVTPSAAAHAERIRARAEERAAASQERDGRQTYERYAERAAAGYRADEALREQARVNELIARGVIAADPEPEDLEEEDVEYEDEEPEDDEEDVPQTTAEKYAAIERERRAAERAVNVRAQTSMVQAMGQPLAPQRRPVVAQPHRYADTWPKPTP
ncbi:hypothetical protein FNH09_23490 [Streptomyces adustus]|uniref:Uncharacterized protein n=1 Tax=Streptomyces adustus TaxID=1609272 RepID=A0A5N8VHE5_9ACTN|nr:hypothetical protein [Streptomyces adustus]MPY34102.1 hypothetical protein [Streptomyces adustus]